MDIPNPFRGSGMKLDGSIGTGGCFLDCRYSAEKMISGVEAHRRLASVSTRISIDDLRFRSRVENDKPEFLTKDTIYVYVREILIYSFYLPTSFSISRYVEGSTYYFTHYE